MAIDMQSQVTPQVRRQEEAEGADSRYGKSEIEPQESKLKETPKAKLKPQSGLTGREIAGLGQLIQERVTADEAYFAWLRGNQSLPLSEWRKRRSQVARARRAEELYVERLFKSRSRKRP